MVETDSQIEDEIVKTLLLDAVVQTNWKSKKKSRVRIRTNDLRSKGIYCYRHWGSGCGTAVERTPINQEVEGSNPTGCWAFFYYISIYSFCPIFMPITEVQDYWFFLWTYFKMSSFRHNKLNLFKISTKMELLSPVSICQIIALRPGMPLKHFLLSAPHSQFNRFNELISKQASTSALASKKPTFLVAVYFRVKWLDPDVHKIVCWKQ